MNGLLELILYFKLNLKHILIDGKAISFVQSFPNGLTGTNLNNASAVVSNCNQDSEAPFLSFPSFNNVNKNNLYAPNELGYLTWKDQQIQNSYGRIPIQSSVFAGINGGVMILFNNRSTNDIQNNNAIREKNKLIISHHSLK